MRDPLTGETATTELEASSATRASSASSSVGLATDYCVKATALDAIAPGLPDTIVLADACAAGRPQPGDGERALAGLEAAGVGIVKTVMR